MSETKNTTLTLQIVGLPKSQARRPAVAHVQQTVLEWYTLESINLNPTIRLQVPSFQIDPKARKMGNLLEASLDKNGRIRGRFLQLI